MITLDTLDRLTELEERLSGLGLEDYRGAVDEALRALGTPAYRFLRTGEAARALGISIPTVKRWARRGILPITRVRGRWLVPAESVERLKSTGVVVGNQRDREELGRRCRLTNSGASWRWAARQIVARSPRPSKESTPRSFERRIGVRPCLRSQRWLRVRPIR